jgi:hypothetical protein
MSPEDIIAEAMEKKAADLERIIASLEFELFGRAQAGRGRLT